MEAVLHTTCRVCGSWGLAEVVNLGLQAVSDFVTPEKVEGVKVPIVLDLCPDCGLVQQRWTAPQDFLYTRHYWYRSGVTATMRAALADVARAAEAKVGGLKPDDVVLDIGSNDGTLLRAFTCGFRVGVEPATNLTEEGRRGVDTFVNDFWRVQGLTDKGHPILQDGKGLTYLRAGKPKVITALGMFYDLEDPNAFITDAAKVLAPDGVFCAQLMCLRSMVNMNDVGNMCHEHLEFYSLKSLHRLFGQNGLEIFEVETNAVNGESYRLWIGHRGKRPVGDSVRQVEMDERCLDQPEFYAEWMKVLRYNKNKCLIFLEREKKRGHRTCAFGASTKGNVILQWYGLGPDLVECALEKSPEKFGKVCAGSGIPIIDEALMRVVGRKGKAKEPHNLLILPYAFLDEFREKLRWFKGKMVVPLPEMRVL